MADEVIGMEQSTELENCNMFLNEDGSSMQFYIVPGRMKEKLRPIIENFGGFISSKLIMGKTMIKLADPAWSNRLGYVSTDFIMDSARKKMLQDINKYRLHGNSSKRPRKAAQAVAQTYNQLRQCQKTRKKYTVPEDQAIINYVKKHACEEIPEGGNVLWRMMETDGVTSHSWSSMKSHYKDVLKKCMESPTKTAKKEKLSVAVIKKLKTVAPRHKRLSKAKSSSSGDNMSGNGLGGKRVARTSTKGNGHGKKRKESEEEEEKESEEEEEEESSDVDETSDEGDDDDNTSTKDCHDDTQDATDDESETDKNKESESRKKKTRGKKRTYDDHIDTAGPSSNKSSSDSDSCSRGVTTSTATSALAVKTTARIPVTRSSSAKKTATSNGKSSTRAHPEKSRQEACTKRLFSESDDSESSRSMDARNGLTSEKQHFFDLFEDLFETYEEILKIQDTLGLTKCQVIHALYVSNGSFEKAKNYITTGFLEDDTEPWTPAEDDIILSGDKKDMKKLSESRGRPSVLERRTFLKGL